MNLDQVLDFTRNWHDGTWRVEDLPDALGMVLRRDTMGRGVMGISSRQDGVSLVTLNARLAADPQLETAILLHEGGHLLTKTGGGMCSPGWKPYASEMPAWQGAGLLAVSAAQAALALEGLISLDEIAAQSGVLPELASIGLLLRRKSFGLASDQRPLGHVLMAWLVVMQARLQVLYQPPAPRFRRAPRA